MGSTTASRRSSCARATPYASTSAKGESSLERAAYSCVALEHSRPSEVERDVPSWSLLVREAEYRICAVGLGTKGAFSFPLSCSFLYLENYFLRDRRLALAVQLGCGESAALGCSRQR